MNKEVQPDDELGPPEIAAHDAELGNPEKDGNPRESRWLRWPFYYLCVSFLLVKGCVVGPILAITEPVTFAAAYPFAAWVFWTWVLVMVGKVQRLMQGDLD